MLEPINDLDRYDYPFNKIDIGHNMRFSVHQMVDLKILESDGFFGRPTVKNSPSVEKLNTLVKGSQVNDNPIIRILYLK